MVTKAEKESAEKIAGYAQRSKELYISRLSSLPESIKENTIKKDYPLVVSNIREACKYALLLGMVHVRFDKDLAAALQAFDQGLAFAQKLEPLLEAAEQVVPSVKIDLLNFFNPLFCCLLSARWPICEQFAKWSTSPVCLVKEPHDNGYFVRLLAALIQGRDDEMSGILAARAKHVGKSAPAHASYFALIEAIAAKDTELFGRELIRIETEFRARAKSRADSSSGYGYGKMDAALDLDFMSIGICKIASKRGIVIDFDSEVVPKAMVDLWR
jgi:hypothetical protein